MMNAPTAKGGSARGPEKIARPREQTGRMILEGTNSSSSSELFSEAVTANGFSTSGRTGISRLL